MNSSLSKDHLFQAYLNGHKKLKYWFGNFYLVVFILILIYSSNPNFFQFEEIKKKHKLVEKINNFYDIKTNAKDSLIVDSVFVAILRFDERKHPLTYMEDEEGEWLKVKHNFLDSLKLLTKSSKVRNRIDQYKMVLDNNLKQTLYKHRNIYRAAGGPKNKLEKYRLHYHEDLFNKLDSLYSKFMKKGILPQIYEENNITEKERQKTIGAFHNTTESRYKELGELNDKPVAKIPFSELSINLRIFLILVTILVYFALTIYHSPLNITYC